MKFTLSWLKDYLDTDASLVDISAALTALGLEVEAVDDPAQRLKAFTVAKILEAQRHPEADKLQVCKVLSDVGELQIVCGAPNARAGLFVALAKEGAYIPGSDFTIKKTKIRGQESNGMLCSFAELALEGDSAGIIELPEAPIGSSVAAALRLDDAVIDIAITPNRGDCLGVYGIARDLAAAGLGILRHPVGGIAAAQDLVQLGKDPAQKQSFSQDYITVATHSPNCSQFVGCYVKGVKNGPSPAWLQARLSAIGLKPISAVVDVTNYISYSFARPLHVFDAAKIQGNLCARDARDGETLHALNDKTYTLKSGMTVIADDAQALGIAGIMGGLASGCTEETQDVFIESAQFDAVNIATTGRALEILSDARYRFERGTDPQFVRRGAEIAAAMIIEFCGGQASELVVAGAPSAPRQIGFQPARVAALSGVEVSQARMSEVLSKLGFAIEERGDDWILGVPSWRPDIDGEADIVEEIVRVVGYAEIPALRLPRASISKRADDRAGLARKALVNLGFLDSCSFSFVSETQASAFGGAVHRLQNPISADLSAMRPSVLPSLLAAASRNLAKGQGACRLSEVGLSFGETQRSCAAGVMVGDVEEVSFAGELMSKKSRAVDAFDAKAAALAVLEALGVNPAQVMLVNTPPAHFHPGRAALITLGGKVQLGVFGELHPTVLKAFDVDAPAVGFELWLENVPEAKKGKAKPALKLPELQALSRDFAFIMKKETSADSLLKAVEKVDKQLIVGAEVFDVYAGKGVDAGEKSMAISITLQPKEKALTDEEIQALSTKVIQAAQSVGARLRG